MSKNKVLSVAEFADLMEVSKSTIYRLIRSNELPVTKGSSGSYKIKLKDAIDYIQTQRTSKSREYKWFKTELEKFKQESDSYEEDVHVTSRRKFLKGTISLTVGFLTGVISEMVGSGGATYVYERFANEVQRKREEQQIIQSQSEMIENLFGRLFNTSWSANLLHFIEMYGKENIWASNTAYASVALGSVLGLNNNDWLDGAILTDDFPGPIQIDSDIIAMGSPVADPVAQLNMEYIGEARYARVRKADPLIELPITYEIGVSLNQSKTAPVKRYVAGIQRNKPNTTIKIDNELLPTPKLDSNGWLRSDYLLITRMPNIISRKGFTHGSEVLIIGGTHGVGTEAIGLLVNNVNLLETIVNKRSTSPYFQILIPVLDIEHGFLDSLAHSRPITLGTPIVREIKIDMERIITIWSQKYS